MAAPNDSTLDALKKALSRRTFLQASGLGAAGLAVAACGGAGGGGGDGGGAGGGGDALSWSNWLGYIDLGDDGSIPSLEAFKQESGLAVKYTEDINDNEEFYAKVRPQLEQGVSIGRDIVVLSDWMAARWIRLGYTEQFTAGSIPNKANVLPSLANVAFDPGRENTLPWQSGFAGLGWNTPLLKEAAGRESLSSLEELWDPKLKGKVSVLSEMRDTIGVIMLLQGKNPADFTADDFESANAELAKQIDSGQIRQVSGNDYLVALENGDVVAVLGWSGDVIALGEDFGFALPESGGTLWTDNAMVPKGSTRGADAEKLLDYYYDPANAALVAASVNYLCPVQGVQAEMEKIAPELADSPWIFPEAATLDGASVFMTLTDAQEAAYNQAFQKTIGN